MTAATGACDPHLDLVAFKYPLPRGLFPGPAELYAIDPHTVHDHGQLPEVGSKGLCRLTRERKCETCSFDLFRGVGWVFVSSSN
jgi:hypothetical protein